jgi:hypothetical protein
MPSIPSLGDILGGQIGEMMGVISDAGSILGSLSSPDRLLEQMCSMANNELQGYFGNLDSRFNAAAEDTFSPVTDRVE